MTDQELLSLVQRSLVEPVDGGASWPSGLWTRDEVITGLNTRMRQYLRDTHAIVTRVPVVVPALTNPVNLPADWIATLHCVWLEETGGGAFDPVAFDVGAFDGSEERHPLSPADAFESDLMLSTWESTPGTPIVYLDGDQGTLTLRLAPVPDTDGVLELMYVSLPAAANGSGVTLSIPDEFLDGIRYGVLGNLLGKVGRGSDPQRAAYAEERFSMGELLTEIILGGWS
jgi:hypothetical protein